MIGPVLLRARSHHHVARHRGSTDGDQRLSITTRDAGKVDHCVRELRRALRGQRLERLERGTARGAEAVHEILRRVAAKCVVAARHSDRACGRDVEHAAAGAQPHGPTLRFGDGLQRGADAREIARGPDRLLARLDPSEVDLALVARNTIEDLDLDTLRGDRPDLLCSRLPSCRIAGVAPMTEHPIHLPSRPFSHPTLAEHPASLLARPEPGAR